MFINFTGCGAIAAIVSAVFGSQGGFVFVPFLSEKEMQGLDGAPVPGMIVLNQNTTSFPGVQYKPLSGATVRIEGSNSTATTDENGHYVIDNLSDGTPKLVAEKSGYISYSGNVVVSSTEGGTVNQFYVTPTNLQIISKRSHQLSAYGTTSDNHTIKPSGVSWGVKKVEKFVNGSFIAVQNDNQVFVDSDGVFTAIVPQVTGKSSAAGSESAPLRVTVQADSNNLTSSSEIIVTSGAGSLSGKVTDKSGNPVSGARVEVALTSYFTSTDSNGNYSLPEVPGNYVITVTAKYGEQTGSITTGVPDGQSVVADIVLGGSQPAAGFTYNSTLGVTGVLGTDNSHFNQPETVAFDSSGNVYIADTQNHRIQKFSSANTYLATIGTGIAGSDNSSFNTPHGVAVDSANNIYVADSNNQRVQKFDSSGNYLQTFGVTGQEGSDNTHFNHPTDVAIDSEGNIYVCDSGNHRVQKLNSSGAYIMTIGTTGVAGNDNSHFGENLSPYNIGIDKNNVLYISDPNPNTRVQVFNSSGNYMATIGVTGSFGSDNSQFNQPGDISFDSSGNIFIVDHFNHRVQMFNSSRSYVATLGITGSAGDSNNNFQRPTGIGVAPDGMIYAGDTFNHRVQIFTR